MSSSPKCSMFFAAALVAMVGVCCLGPTASAQLAEDQRAVDSKRIAEPARAPASPSLAELAVRGGPLMIPIAFCSVVMLAVAADRSLALRRSKIMPQKLLDELQLLGQQERVELPSIERMCQRYPGPLANMLRAATGRAGRPMSEVEKAVEDAGVREIGKLQTPVRWLQFIANVSPLLGLLGTMQGMIAAFITTSQAGLGKAELLAEGIYMALVTSFAGLTVAIPALTFAHYFSSKLHGLVHTMDELLLPLIAKLGK